MSDEIHLPPWFEEKGKPHFVKSEGHWWVIWPRARPPMHEEVVSYSAFCRYLNGWTAPHPSSVHCATHETLQ